MIEVALFISIIAVIILIRSKTMNLPVYKISPAHPDYTHKKVRVVLNCEIPNKSNDKKDCTFETSVYVHNAFSYEDIVNYIFYHKEKLCGDEINKAIVMFKSVYKCEPLIKSVTISLHDIN